MKKTNTSQKTKKIVIIGLFTALSFVVSAVLPIKVSFLTLDFKDAVSTICGMFFGPLAGLVCALIVPFIEVTYSGTGFYGLIMNIISSVTLVGISSMIYKYKKTIWGAVVGLLAAAAATMGIMTLANILITPHYLDITTGMDLVAARATVKSLLPATIIPFNVVKSILNASIAMLLYKPISRMLKKMGVGNSEKAINDKSTVAIDVEIARKNKMRSIIVTSISAVIIVAAFVVVFVVLGGEFK